jgi:hypothetical protein
LVGGVVWLVWVRDVPGTAGHGRGEGRWRKVPGWNRAEQSLAGIIGLPGGCRWDRQGHENALPMRRWTKS